MPTGYESIYEELLPLLSRCDIKAKARLLGLKTAGENAIAELFGVLYTIKNSGVYAEGGGNIIDRSLIIHYLLSEGGIEPSGNFVPVGRMTDAIEGRTAQSGWFLGEQTAKLKQRGYAGFAKAAKALGGVYSGEKNGGKSWILYPFPKIPMQVLFFEADDEFPCDVQLYFDETARYYMGFEALCFLCGRLAKVLADKAVE